MELTKSELENLDKINFEKKILIEWIDFRIEQYKIKENKDLSMVEILFTYIANIDDLLLKNTSPAKG